MAVSLAKLPDDAVGRIRPVREEQDSLAISARRKRIVDIERDRCARRRTIFDERGAKGTAVEVRIELVGPVKGESLIVGDIEPVRPGTDIAPDIHLPLPGGEESAELARVAVNRVVDARALDRPVEVGS